MNKPKIVDNDILNECINILLYSNKNLKISRAESLAYQIIVDNIIANKSSVLLKDLYETDKITLHDVVKKALSYCNNNKIAKRIIND